jgi:hypothetical protein
MPLVLRCPESLGDLELQMRQGGDWGQAAVLPVAFPASKSGSSFPKIPVRPLTHWISAVLPSCLRAERTDRITVAER